MKHYQTSHLHAFEYHFDDKNERLHFVFTAFKARQCIKSTTVEST